MTRPLPRPDGRPSPGGTARRPTDLAGVRAVVHRHGLPAAILAAGAALQALLWSRQGIFGHQFDMLLSGLEVLSTGDLPPVAGDGFTPGALLPLLAAGPLALWPDYRAPGLLAGLSHFVAVAVLSLCIGRALGARFLVAWLAVYWLSPWRLVFGGLAWEPAYAVLPAALHLASAYRLRERAHPGWSLLHGATLTIAVQLHAACFALTVLTALLAAGRRVHLHVRGALVGALAGGLTLIPTAQALIAGDLPRILPANPGDLPRVLVGIMNVPMSLTHWFRLGSPHLELWLETAAEAETAFARGLTGAVVAASTLSVGLALFASRRWFGRRPHRDPDRRTSPADRLRADAGWCFAALCTAVAVSPAPIRGWDPLNAVHAVGRPVGAVIAAGAVSAALALFAARRRFRRRSPGRPTLSGIGPRPGGGSTSAAASRPRRDRASGISPRPGGGSTGGYRRGSPADWLRAYAGWCLAALCTAAALSPAPVMALHMPFALPAACLPVAAWVHAAFSAPSVLPRATAVAFILLEVAVVLLLAFGHPSYTHAPVDTLERINRDVPDAVRELVP